jgi:hypothetical protein
VNLLTVYQAGVELDVNSNVAVTVIQFIAIFTENMSGSAIVQLDNVPMDVNQGGMASIVNVQLLILIVMNLVATRQREHVIFAKLVSMEIHVT